LRDVLRLQTGDTAEIFDGEGRTYVGDVVLHGSEVLVRGLRSVSSYGSRGHLILAAALIRPARFEWALEKATELGVAEIYPLKTRRCSVRLADRIMDSRLDRWDRILKEAARQCGRSAAPRLHRPQDFYDFLRAGEPAAGAKYILHEKSDRPWRPDQGVLAERSVLCVGPEGGWDAVEIEQAVEAGYGVFSLGPWVLRAETAMVAAVAIFQHQFHLSEKA
jgi:16S rRNA (uracil1498-N3)-methyltransferase